MKVWAYAKSFNVHVVACSVKLVNEISEKIFRSIKIKFMKQSVSNFVNKLWTLILFKNEDCLYRFNNVHG